MNEMTDRKRKRERGRSVMIVKLLKNINWLRPRCFFSKCACKC